MNHRDGLGQGAAFMAKAVLSGVTIGLCLLAASSGRAESPSRHLAQAACPSASLERLGQAVQATRDAIRSNNANAFLSQVGSQGLTLGTDGPTLSAALLTSGFAHKDDVYCELFTCKSGRGQLGRQILAANPSLDISVVRGRAFGKAMINPGRQGEVAMDYVYVASCRFELTAIGGI